MNLLPLALLVVVIVAMIRVFTLKTEEYTRALDGEYVDTRNSGVLLISSTSVHLPLVDVTEELKHRAVGEKPKGDEVKHVVDPYKQLP